MSDAAFANADQPHGAIFDDVPKHPYHFTDAAMLRAAYGPSAVPAVDPSDEDYAWTEQTAPAGLPAAQATTDPMRRELVAMGNAIGDLQRDVQYLSELVQRLERIVNQVKAL